MKRRILDNFQGPLLSLKILYQNMPATQGCEKCEDINKENAFWCCHRQNPSMYYVEFLYVWNKVQEWSKSKRLELILRCIRNYLSNSFEKGCVFWDNECTCYERRPLNCRFYGIIPPDGWAERLEIVKKRYGDEYTPRDQCNLVSTVDGKGMSKEQEDKWFRHVRECEQRIGVTKSTIDKHDDEGGSYRAFHDHILLEFFDKDFLGSLTKTKQSNPSAENIELIVQSTRESIVGTLQSKMSRR